MSFNNYFIEKENQLSLITLKYNIPNPVQNLISSYIYDKEHYITTLFKFVEYKLLKLNINLVLNGYDELNEIQKCRLTLRYNFEIYYINREKKRYLYIRLGSKIYELYNYTSDRNIYNYENNKYFDDYINSLKVVHNQNGLFIYLHDDLHFKIEYPNKTIFQNKMKDYNKSDVFYRKKYQDKRDTNEVLLKDYLFLMNNKNKDIEIIKKHKFKCEFLKPIYLRLYNSRFFDFFSNMKKIILKYFHQNMDIDENDFLEYIINNDFLDDITENDDLRLLNRIISCNSDLIDYNEIDYLNYNIFFNNIERYDYINIYFDNTILRSDRSNW